MQKIAHGLVRDHGCDRGVHAAGTRNDGHVIDGCFEGFNALRNELLSVEHVTHRR